MPTTDTFPCACCQAVDCCSCHDCCFSDHSQVLLTWSIAGRDAAYASACHCPEPAVQGSMTLAFETCQQQMVRWSATTCEASYPCGEFDGWRRARVWRDCGTGRWHVQVDALINDTQQTPCQAQGVVACTLLLADTDQGDCCGVEQAQSDFAFGCCHADGQVQVTWTVQVLHNVCCRDGNESVCVAGEPDCDGLCDDQELP